MAIVGAGHVGGRAAQTLRESGWQDVSNKYNFISK
jgi:hypothetical protein